MSTHSTTADLIVIGAGVAGLTAAALAARAGARVLVLERHNIAGGCASYYQRAGFRFDVGATVAGGFGPRGIHERVFRALGVELAAERIDPAMVVHLPDCSVTRYGDARWPVERRRAFGASGEPFWQAQERVAAAAWKFAAGLPALPRDVATFRHLLRAFSPALLAIVPTLGQTVAAHLPADNPVLRRFVDAQLLITAQGSSAQTDWLYGATALDLAREGTYHLPGGIGDIAVALARAVRTLRGEIAYNTHAQRVESRAAGGYRIHTATGIVYEAARVISAIPLDNTLQLLPQGAARNLRRSAAKAARGYGAVMAYVGLAPGVVPTDFPSHHQIVHSYDAPMGEGETAFLSFSAPGDARRARNGGSAVTISTHTDPLRWERAFAAGSYAEERAKMGTRLLAALERVLPGAGDQRVITEFATPHTFEVYTGRAHGYVGGAPQKPWQANLFALDHHTGLHHFWLCGDSVFPGQSTVGAALSGINAARAAYPAAANI